MGAVEDGIARLVAQDHPRAQDLDELHRRQTEHRAADLFADGLEIAQRILDWEEEAGQPIGPLIAHIRAAQDLRKSVTAKARGEEAEANQAPPASA